VLRIGLIGAGYMMQVVHLMSLRAIDGVELAAIADLDTALAERVARANGIPRVYPSADELVAREEGLDAVVVVTNKNHHAQAAVPALARGIPTFVEKPLAATIEDGRRMVELAERTGTLLMVGYMKRFDPAVRELLNLLRSNALGTLRYARLHDFGGNWTVGAPRLGAFRLDETPAAVEPVRPVPPAADEQTEALNEWREVWIHDVNLARALFGEPRAIISAGRGLPRLVEVEFAQTRALLEVGPLTYPGGPWDERVTIYGWAGRAELVFPAPLLFRQPARLVIETAAGEQRPALPDREAFTEEILHFLRCVAYRQEPLTSGREGLRDLEFCAAIVDAAYGSHPASSESTTTDC
jgi:predicted dehydrogenase